jgi:hypothetical protein
MLIAAAGPERIESAETGRDGTGRFRGWTPGVWRALIVVCAFFVFQQVTGINVPLY